MDARTQRIRDAIARLEDAFPPHQARAIIGYAEALGTEPAPAEQAQATLTSDGLHLPTLGRALERFRNLLEVWEVRLGSCSEMSTAEVNRLQVCRANLAAVIEKVEAGNV